MGEQRVKGPGKGVTRRGILCAATSFASSAVLQQSAASETGDNAPPHIPQWQTRPGAEVMSPPYGLPSKFEAAVVRRERSGGSPYPTRQAAISLTPLQDLDGIITPNGLHYERHHAPLCPCCAASLPARALFRPTEIGLAQNRVNSAI
jgi:hypothetical protein